MKKEPDEIIASARKFQNEVRSRYNKRNRRQSTTAQGRVYFYLKHFFEKKTRSTKDPAAKGTTEHNCRVVGRNRSG